MLHDIAIRLIAPVFAPLYAQSRYYVVYLASAALLGALVLWFRQPRGQRTSAAVLAKLFRSDVFLHPSALLDYRFVVINHALFAAVLGAMLFSVNTATGWVVNGLTALAGPSSGAQAGWLASIAFTLLVFVVTDFAQFVGHYIQHRIPILWEFHKVHHSAEVLTPVTAIRVHPVSDMVATQVFGGCMGLVNGAFLYVYHGPVAEIAVLSVNVLVFLHFTIGAYHLSHSHVWLMFPKGFREVFLSPALHLIHHSSDPRHYDKNFALYLTVWDRMFGTLYMPADEEQHGLVLGVGAEQPDYQTVWQLYSVPFVKAVRLLGARPPSTARAGAS